MCRGDSDAELLREAERHLREDHPELVGRVLHRDLLAMAVDVGTEPIDEPDVHEGELVVRRSDGIVTLVLNRPTRRNALSLELIRLLRRTLHDTARDRTVRAVIVAGAGPAFCAGHDLHELRGSDERAARELFETDSALMQELHEMPQPVVARVHGAASAAGCHLVAACDLAVASPGATFAVPGPAIGLSGATAIAEIARLVGRRRALQMVLSGSPVSAETALQWGLVNAVVPAGDLVVAARAIALAASGGAPGATAAAKRAVYGTLDISLPVAYDQATDLMWRAAPGLEAQEGISAFLGKRAPDWRSSESDP